MKANIIKTKIDYLQISKTTSVVQSLTNREPIIFMNGETADRIKVDLEKNLTIYKDSSETNNNGYIARLEGYKVFIDNDLKYGEIEVR